MNDIKIKVKCQIHISFAPRLVFLVEKNKVRKIWLIFDVENDNKNKEMDI